MIQPTLLPNNQDALNQSKRIKIARSNPLSKSHIHDLSKWGFEFFDLFMKYAEKNDFEAALSEVISDEEFIAIQERRKGIQ